MSDLTTVSIYQADLSYLKRKQLELSATKGELMPIRDVIRELIELFQATVIPSGAVLTPHIDDIGAFNTRTRELRELGFTEEADARDSYAKQAGK